MGELVIMVSFIIKDAFSREPEHAGPRTSGALGSFQNLCLAVHVFNGCSQTCFVCEWRHKRRNSRNLANPLIHLEVVFCCILASQWLCSVCLISTSWSLSLKPRFERSETNAFKIASKPAKNRGRWRGSGRSLPDSRESVEPERSEAERRPR